MGKAAIWFEEVMQQAGPGGLRRAGVSFHEQAALSSMTTAERMRAVGADRIADVYAAARGAPEITYSLRLRLRCRFEHYLAEVEFDELTAPADPLGPIEGVWP
jgi:hypothetical protein